MKTHLKIFVYSIIHYIILQNNINTCNTYHNKHFTLWTEIQASDFFQKKYRDTLCFRYFSKKVSWYSILSVKMYRDTLYFRYFPNKSIAILDTLGIFTGSIEYRDTLKYLYRRFFGSTGIAILPSSGSFYMLFNYSRLHNM